MELPDELYRVESSYSVSRFDEEQGILPGNPTWHPNDYDDRDAVKAAVAKHLDWNNRKPTPFISTTNSQARALKEAKRKRDDGETDVQIIMVDPHLLVEDMGAQFSRVDTCGHIWYARISANVCYTYRISRNSTESIHRRCILPLL